MGKNVALSQWHNVDNPDKLFNKLTEELENKPKNFDKIFVS